MFKEKIRIGTLVKGGPKTGDYIRRILPHGFESFSITFWQTLGGCDLKALAADVKDALAGSDAVISSICVFGNPLERTAAAKATRDGWKALIDAADLFDTDVVAGFAGRLADKPIDQNIKRYAQVFGPLQKRAAGRGVRLAFENCPMGGNWQSGGCNIAMDPSAWELMFDAIPSENIGLQWEPCHQMVRLIDPIPQLRKWVDKVFALHGKDATIMWDVLSEYGYDGPKQWAYHRTPGFGDSNWTDIISILRMADFDGSIDIEGWHDPVYRDDLEMTGQVRGLNYLKDCRGGDYVENPS